MEIPKTSPDKDNNDVITQLLAEYFSDYNPKNMDSIQWAREHHDKLQQSVELALELGPEVLEEAWEKHGKGRQKEVYSTIYEGKSLDELQEYSKALRVIRAQIERDLIDCL